METTNECAYNNNNMLGFFYFYFGLDGRLGKLQRNLSVIKHLVLLHIKMPKDRSPKKKAKKLSPCKIKTFLFHFILKKNVEKKQDEAHKLNL